MSLILKEKGIAYGLCHEGCNILFRFCLPCMPRCCTCLIPDADNAGLSCCWICQTYPWIHIELNQLSWRLMRIALCIFIVLPSLNIFMPETSVADKHNDCMPVLIMPKDHGSVFAHPCTTCSGGKWHEWQNGDPLLRALGKGLFCFLFNTKGCRGWGVDGVWNPSHSC